MLGYTTKCYSAGGIKFRSGKVWPPEVARGGSMWLRWSRVGSARTILLRRSTRCWWMGDRQLVKSIASADRIAMMLPPGESSVRKG